MDGPCQVAVEVSAAASSAMRVQCEAGGSATIVSPARSIEAIGGAHHEQQQPNP